MGKIYIKRNNVYKYFARTTEKGNYELVIDPDINKIHLSKIKKLILVK